MTKFEYDKQSHIVKIFYLTPMIKKLRFTMFFTLASLFSVLVLAGCGKHSFEDIFDSDIDGFSSSSNVEELGSSSSGNGIVPGVVGPLLKTQWHQGVPFNVLPDGRRVPWIGCGTIALAQIMKYHNHPERGTGQSEPYRLTTSQSDPTLNGFQPSVNFDVAYDWDNMLNTYTSSATERQQNAVSTLTYHIAVSGRRDYVSGGSGVIDNSESTRLTQSELLVTHFGYDRGIRRLWRQYYSDAEWKATIKAQLDAGLPIWYHGLNQERTVDHAFVIDGYDTEGRFHVNWGWSGENDGWYSLNNEFNNFTGAHRGHYDFNYHQHIIINIKPDRGGVPDNFEMALENFTADKSSMPQNEMFAVTLRMRNISNFGGFPGGQWGTALVDGNNNIVAVIGSINFGSVRAQGLTGLFEINSSVPETISPGQYRLMSVIRPAGGEWEIIARSAVGDGVPNAIPFTVTPEESATPGGGYGMGLTTFATSTASISRNEQFTVDFTLRNMAQEIFPGGQAGVALIDNDGNIVETFGVGNTNLRNPGGTTALITRNITIPNTVAPGQYQLRIVIRPTGGEWRIATLSLPGVPNSIDFTVE